MVSGLCPWERAKQEGGRKMATARRMTLADTAVRDYVDRMVDRYKDNPRSPYHDPASAAYSVAKLYRADAAECVQKAQEQINTAQNLTRLMRADQTHQDRAQGLAAKDARAADQALLKARRFTQAAARTRQQEQAALRYADELVAIKHRRGTAR